MPAPIKLLVTKHKLSPDDLKAAFDASTIVKRPKVEALVKSIGEKIRMGIDRNRKDYRLFKAMDWAYDQPFYQVSYTQLRGLLSNKPDDKKVLETIKQWGLTHLLPDAYDSAGRPCCDEQGKPKKAINLPVFTNVFVPIVMAYITIRWAKLFNDRNVNPHFKYEPVQYTKENRFRCEVVTQAVQRMSSWFDYPADTKQTILQTLIYGFCINFPREAWFVERQLNEEGKEIISREGLRFSMPHPSRIYVDQYQRMSTLNSNSGCSFAGYWELCRYKDINDNEQYWNKDKISVGSTEWFDIGRSDFLEQVYPCNMSFPSMSSSDGIGGAGPLNRESAAARFYTTAEAEAATLVTNHFERIIPKDNGLGTYEYPVWFRFRFASDSTVIFAEPLAFDRIPTYAYDADFNRSRFRSMALETVPSQDMIGNLLSQWILAVQQNLINPIFFDQDKLPKEYVKVLENMGQKMMNGNNFFPFSSTENWRSNVNQKEAFFQPQFAKHDTSQIQTLIAGVLSMLDRIMQLSPQEIGQAASHEQTAEESRIIANNTSTRVAFTGTFIDDGDYAKKVMIYDAMMAHADDEIVVGVSSSLVGTEDEFKNLMKTLGITLEDGASYDPSSPDLVRQVKVGKSALKIEAFASTRDKADRIDNAGVAEAMSKVFTAVANNEYIIQSIGPIQLVELLNQIIVAAGLPKEFKLRGQNIDPQASQEQQAEELSKTLQGMAEQIRQAIDQSSQQTLEAAAQQSAQIVGEAMAGIGQQLTPVVEAVAQTGEAVAQANQVNQLQQQEIQTLGQAVSQLNDAISAVVAAAPPVQPAMPAPIAQPVAPATPIGIPA